MRRIRRGIFTLGLAIFGISLILLLNFTAPNPTHRRASSRSVLIVGNPSEIGDDAENVLSSDLGLPRNDAPGQRQCFCRGPVGIPGTCLTCIIRDPALGAASRRPDFISDYLIADSKNTQVLNGSDRDFSQLKDYARVAQKLGRPLWVFTRVNTEVDAAYVDEVKRTGGGVVPYFLPKGMADPIDEQAQAGLAFSMGLIGLSAMLEVQARKSLKTVKVSVHESSPTSDRPNQKPDPVKDVAEALQRADDAIAHTRKKLS